MTEIHDLHGQKDDQLGAKNIIVEPCRAARLVTSTSARTESLTANGGADHRYEFLNTLA